MVRRLAIVTGANKGLGYCIAQQLLDADLDVIIGCRSVERGEVAAKALGERCRFEQLDVADPASIARFGAKMQAELPMLHVLVNNAGIAFKNDDPTPFSGQTGPTLNTNFWGLLAVTEQLLPLLRAADSPRLVNIASMAGRLDQVSPELQKQFTSESLTVPELKKLVEHFKACAAAGTHKEHGWGSSNYGLSKLAVIAYTRILARQEPKILINCCCPGYCRTDMTSNRGPRPPEEGARTATKLALLPPESHTTGEFWQDEKPKEW